MADFLHLLLIIITPTNCNIKYLTLYCIKSIIQLQKWVEVGDVYDASASGINLPGAPPRAPVVHFPNLRRLFYIGYYSI